MQPIAPIDIHHAGIDSMLRRLRALRDRMQRPRVIERDEHDHRRAEDQIRDEHHDAHARVVTGNTNWQRDRRMRNVGSAVVDDQNLKTSRAGSSPSFAKVVANLMRIRIVKHLPAPKMDGFDVRGLDVDHIYDVDSRVGRYLIVAGYAVDAVEGDAVERDQATDRPQRKG